MSLKSKMTLLRSRTTEGSKIIQVCTTERNNNIEYTYGWYSASVEIKW
jgi:hypothetical protein